MKCFNVAMSENEGVKELIKSIGFENFAFIYDMNGKDYFSCSCGYCNEYRKEKIRFRDKNNPICPKCKTPIVFDDIDVFYDGRVVKYDTYVLQDDDEFLIAGFSVDGITINEGDLDVSSEEDEEIVFVYDKKKSLFFPLKLDDVPSYNKKRWASLSPFHGDLEYCQDGVYDNNGDRIAVMASSHDIDFDCSLKMPYDIEEGIYPYCGISELRRIFGMAAGIDMNPEVTTENLGFAITEIFAKINFGYTKDKDYETCCPSWVQPISNYGIPVDKYFEFKALGIDLKADTFEKAFGMTLEELARFRYDEDYQIRKKLLNDIKAQNLSEFEMELINKFTENYQQKLFNMSKRYGVDFKEFLRCAGRAKDISPERAIEELNIIFDECGKEEAERIVNMHVPYSSKYMSKFSFVKYKKLTIDQYDEIMKKPTLDTFIKVVGL